jgi:hypothetical protein
MRRVNELVPIATGTVPAHVVNQDEKYIWPVGLFCSFLGADPGEMNPDTAEKNKQWNVKLHLATSAGQTLDDNHKTTSSRQGGSFIFSTPPRAFYSLT